ncbi:hypothetical protein DSM106972_025920 [Dulcicalothrix desertica PCC 7102]|uniref:Uncharacterized protein n=1 Tax=Dulcicalothrix desertica PCC 7102 TaxID=232991 RepID=A0A3S1ARK9_9CYAN|nr:hypothetical protein [Dulcicalothrix desertica]RUT07331.1 hypothetical protein DSM106972_025920 [Dulcicalothrix desertica PCC 7102]TWH55472.1 hypothetical protein CAL7102_03614 [Dulcicalothrix desertica PCC 7102]
MAKKERQESETNFFDGIKQKTEDAMGGIFGQSNKDDEDRENINFRNERNEDDDEDDDDDDEDEDD